ncbi:hypothetical protein AXF42_Ash005749 [Apostasia shenzhenica]|uniref:Uncharacterized protein n=1 Tax=Apostasia shenzhenica TaxID=1088818 RepID=A0A2I0BC95_9ASPA|nr:hypothetical protein AXF42_Ash005749 [Apostasia shenzhenica]
MLSFCCFWPLQRPDKRREFRACSPHFLQKTRIKLHCPPPIYALEQVSKTETDQIEKTTRTTKAQVIPLVFLFHTVLEPQLKSSLSPSKHCISSYDYPFFIVKSFC